MMAHTDPPLIWSRSISAHHVLQGITVMLKTTPLLQVVKLFRVFATLQHILIINVNIYLTHATCFPVERKSTPIFGKWFLHVSARLTRKWWNTGFCEVIGYWNRYISHLIVYLVIDTGLCNAGYYCVMKSLSSSPAVVDVRGGPCPQGYYCPEGSDTYTACPKGTYGDRDKLTAETDCVVCPPGEYCDLTGMSAPAGSCLEGYYCSERWVYSNSSALQLCDI